MQTFIPNEADLAKLKLAAKFIERGNASQAKGKKETETGKMILAQWLAENRDCDITSLGIGSLVEIESVVLIKIGKQTKLDQKTLQLEQPGTFTKYQKDFPTIKFEPMI